MNPNNEKYIQNGGQISQISVKSAKHVLKNRKKDKVCREYVWGKCIRAQCNLPHECDIETMLEILQFCHDNQNSTGCKRPNCTFLHVTREEEKLFREKGQFPSDLIKRHNQMNAANMSRKAEEPYLTKPPLPPHENQQALPPPKLMVNPMYQPMVPPWFLQPPPPPPKEPSPPPCPGPPINAAQTTYAQQLRNTSLNMIDTSKPPPLLPQQIINNNSIKRLPEPSQGLPSKSSIYNVSQPLPHITPRLDVVIDTSKPPPPLLMTQVKNLEKRTLSKAFGPTEAGHSKSRKIDSDSGTCENCMRWELRNLLTEKKKKEKFTEKAILLLKQEEKKNEITSIIELLRGLGIPQGDTSNSDSYDPSTLDLYAINDPENQLTRTLLAKFLQDDAEFLSQTRKVKDGVTNDNIRSGQVRHVEKKLESMLPEPSGPSSAVSTHTAPPPLPPQFTVPQTYHRPVNNQFNPYFSPGPSNGVGDPSMPKPHINTVNIPPTTVMPPFSDPNSYYHMMDRPPPPFPPHT